VREKDPSRKKTTEISKRDRLKQSGWKQSKKLVTKPGKRSRDPPPRRKNNKKPVENSRQRQKKALVVRVGLGHREGRTMEYGDSCCEDMKVREEVLNRAEGVQDGERRMGERTSYSLLSMPKLQSGGTESAKSRAGESLKPEKNLPGEIT